MSRNSKPSRFSRKAIAVDFQKNRLLYLMALPGIILVILFNYLPMGGLLMAFENYRPKQGILGSEFVGLQNFADFFGSVFFGRVLKNTLAISLLQLVIEFPLTIIFALLLNEITGRKFRRTITTVSSFPYFISMVVMAGIIIDFCGSRGVITQAVSVFTGSQQNVLGVPEYWRPLYITTDIWKDIGFGSIIYVAALAGVDKELYEAAEIDGAGKWKQMLHVTLPGIAPTITIMLILRVGQLMSVGYEKTILLYNSQIYETADIISSFVYRKGLLEANYGFSTAVSLFNSVINLILLLITNKISSKVSETSLF